MKALSWREQIYLMIILRMPNSMLGKSGIALITMLRGLRGRVVVSITVMINI